MAPCSRAQLLRVWQAYVKHRKAYVKATTWEQDYPPFTTRFNNAPQWLETSDHVLEWLTENYSHDVARRTLQQIKAAFEWADTANVARSDPFKAIANLPKQTTDQNNWRAFPPSERAAILKAFDSKMDHARWWAYGLFWTGCRPEELRALQISDVSASLHQLSIVKAYRIGASAPHQPKTNCTTPDFPVNDQLRELLRECIGDRKKGWLFPALDGGPMQYKNFQTRQWKPVVEGLAAAGEVEWYLPQKHARHTWITSMLRAGTDINTVAYLARNSPGVILAHYAQRSKSPIIPRM